MGALSPSLLTTMMTEQGSILFGGRPLQKSYKLFDRWVWAAFQKQRVKIKLTTKLNTLSTNVLFSTKEQLRPTISLFKGSNDVELSSTFGVCASSQYTQKMQAAEKLCPTNSPNPFQSHQLPAVSAEMFAELMLEVLI
jgi:hypothetical protein